MIRARVVVLAVGLVASGAVGSGGSETGQPGGRTSAAAPRLGDDLPPYGDLETPGPRRAPRERGTYLLPEIAPRTPGPVPIPQARPSEPAPVPMPEVAPVDPGHDGITPMSELTRTR